MIEKLIFRKPALLDHLLWISKNPEKFKKCQDAGDVIEKNGKRIAEIANQPITKKEALSAIRDQIERARRELVLPWLTHNIYQTMTRGNPNWNVRPLDKPGYFFLAIMDPELINEAEKILIEPSEAISEEDRIRERSRLEGEREKARAFIKKTIPAELIPEYETEFYRTQMSAAYSFWHDLQSATDGPVDFHGTEICDENPNAVAYHFLNLDRLVRRDGSARFTPNRWRDVDYLYRGM